MSFNIMMVNDRFTTVINNKSYTVNLDHPNYETLLECVKTEDAEGFVDNFTVEKEVQRTFANTVVELKDGTVFYKGEALHNALTNRIVQFSRNELPVEPMLAFLGNLMENPSRRAVNELYGFLEHRNMPITDDGCFLAYKSVRENYLDKYSGTFDNSVGEVMEMPRNEVDDEAGRTCSVGFHVGALEYAGPDGFYHNYGDKIMIVKVNPKDAVSVPADHSAQKLRVCRYEVVGEYDQPLDDNYDNSYDKEELVGEVELDCNKDCIERDEGLLVPDMFNKLAAKIEHFADAHGYYVDYESYLIDSSASAHIKNILKTITDELEQYGVVNKEHSHFFQVPYDVFGAVAVKTNRRKIKSESVFNSIMVCYNTDETVRWISLKSVSSGNIFLRVTDTY